MANQLYRFTVSVVDDDGVRTSTHQYALIPEATSGTNVQVTLGDWATAVAALMDGGVLRCEASLVVDPSVFSLPATPSGSEECSENGEFQYNLTGSDFVWTFAVPTFIEAAVAGNIIDLANTAVIALNTLLTSSLFTTGSFCSPDKLPLGTRKATFLGTRKHRRQQHAKSYQLG
jgi:hypothetical protein